MIHMCNLTQIPQKIKEIDIISTNIKRKGHALAWSFVYEITCSNISNMVILGASVCPFSHRHTK
jgi:hypothetical protein